MNCKKCGNILDPSDTSCKICGSPVLINGSEINDFDLPKSNANNLLEEIQLPQLAMNDVAASSQSDQNNVSVPNISQVSQPVVPTARPVASIAETQPVVDNVDLPAISQPVNNNPIQLPELANSEVVSPVIQPQFADMSVQPQVLPNVVDDDSVSSTVQSINVNNAVGVSQVAVGGNIPVVNNTQSTDINNQVVSQSISQNSQPNQTIQPVQLSQPVGFSQPPLTVQNTPSIPQESINNNQVNNVVDNTKKKNSNLLFIIIVSILSIVIILLIVALIIGLKRSDLGKNPNIPSEQKEITESVASANTIDFDGVSFVVPEEYSVSEFENAYGIYNDKINFQIALLEGPFEVYREQSDVFKNMLMEDGFNISKYQDKKIDKRSYLLYYLSDEPNSFIIFGEVDGNYSFTGTLSFDSSLNLDESLKKIDSIIGTAKVTSNFSGNVGIGIDEQIEISEKLLEKTI